MADEWLNGVQGTEVLPLINSDDPVIRVEAGPGTGKTFGLVRRVQRLLHPAGGNVRGTSVLVVAFNRVIAKQLGDDIAVSLLGSPHDGDPTVRTVHALCLEAIGANLRLLLPHEYEAMVYDILAEYPQLRAEFTSFPKAQQALRDHEAGHATYGALMHAAERWLIRHHATLISQVPMLLLEKLQSGEPPPSSMSTSSLTSFRIFRRASTNSSFACAEHQAVYWYSAIPDSPSMRFAATTARALRGYPNC